jgi:ferrous iron transport protein A
MKENFFPLSLVPPGKEVIVVAIHGGRGLRMRLTEMGLKEGMKLKVLHSYGSGPCIIQVGDTRLVLGYGMAQKIFVKEV